MSELKDIVPSLELCKMIPKGEFAESALIWSDWRNGDGGKRGFAVYFRENLLWPNSLPAPTPTEILASLPFGTIIMQDEPNVWVCISQMGAMVRKADSAANAALKVWLKINNIEVKL